MILPSLPMSTRYPDRRRVRPITSPSQDSSISRTSIRIPSIWYPVKGLRPVYRSWQLVALISSSRHFLRLTLCASQVACAPWRCSPMNVRSSSRTCRQRRKSPETVGPMVPGVVLLVPRDCQRMSASDSNRQPRKSGTPMTSSPS